MATSDSCLLTMRSGFRWERRSPITQRRPRCRVTAVSQRKRQRVSAGKFPTCWELQSPSFLIDIISFSCSLPEIVIARKCNKPREQIRIFFFPLAPGWLTPLVRLTNTILFSSHLLFPLLSLPDVLETCRSSRRAASRSLFMPCFVLRYQPFHLRCCLCSFLQPLRCNLIEIHTGLHELSQSNFLRDYSRVSAAALLPACREPF